MSHTSPLTPEQLARAEDRLRNPAPGSKIAAAKEFGVDLTLLIENLRLSYTDRLRKAQDLANQMQRLTGATRKAG